jgi:hypothetical protein
MFSHTFIPAGIVPAIFVMLQKSQKRKLYPAGS